MKRKALGRVAALAAALGMAAPPQLFAAELLLPVTPAQQSAATVADVALGVDGSLAGQAMTLQGQPLVNQTVLMSNGQRQMTATTDAKGQFRFTGLRGGAYTVTTSRQTLTCRAWKAGTEPPNATRGLMIVQGTDTALGQCCGSEVGCGTPVTSGIAAGARDALRNPLVIGGIIAAAIAIPVAIHNSGDDDTAS